MKEQDAEINAQFNTISSLRFHNIKVPVDQRGKIIHPVDIDDLLLQVCNTKFGLDIKLDPRLLDIGR
jgi:hypothetical protein